MTATVELRPSELARAEKVGRYIARTWPVDSKDVVQHLMAWMCANIHHLEKWRPEGAHGGNKLGKSLQREASRFCRREYERSQSGLGAYRAPTYRLEEVEAALTVMLNYPDWQGVQHEDALALLADVSSVFHGLPKDDKIVLSLRYGNDLRFSDIAEHLEVSTDHASQRVKRALGRLHTRICGEGANWERSSALTGSPPVLAD